MDILKKKRAGVIPALCALVILLTAACGIYLGDYYRADDASIAAFTEQGAVPYVQQENRLVFQPEDAETGFIFYPGGKVEYTAYIPLMECLASRGVLCVLVQMPGNLAVLDIDAAEGIPPAFPQIENWYIGGHSLGGAMASSYLGKTSGEFAGLVLLGAYSTADLSGSGLAVLSIYGSEDGVMNREKYNANLGNLPEDFTEIVISGGCHAGFGMYGSQEGDGIPTLSAEAQIHETADAILEMVRSRSE